MSEELLGQVEEWVCKECLVRDKDEHVIMSTGSKVKRYDGACGRCTNVDIRATYGIKKVKKR